jgi:hypothetical protein
MSGLLIYRSGANLPTEVSCGSSHWESLCTGRAACTNAALAEDCHESRDLVARHRPRAKSRAESENQERASDSGCGSSLPSLGGSRKDGWIEVAQGEKKLLIPPHRIDHVEVRER